MYLQLSKWKKKPGIQNILYQTDRCGCLCADAFGRKTLKTNSFYRVCQFLGSLLCCWFRLLKKYSAVSFLPSSSLLFKHTVLTIQLEVKKQTRGLYYIYRRGSLKSCCASRNVPAQDVGTGWCVELMTEPVVFKCWDATDYFLLLLA